MSNLITNGKAFADALCVECRRRLLLALRSNRENPTAVQFRPCAECLPKCEQHSVEVKS